MIKTFLFLLFSVIFLSSCTLKDEAKLKILDKVDQKVQEEKQKINLDNKTDIELLKELESSDSTTLDTDLRSLEQELN